MSHLEDRPLTTQEETMEILISLVRGKSSTNPNYFRMKKQVSCSIQRNEILFTGMLRKLESLSKHRSTEELCNDLKEIFNNLIENEQISWGKIIAIFSFSVFIAEKHLEMRDRIVRFSGDYLVEKSTRWIDAQGGWKTFALIDSNPEADRWKNLLTYSICCCAFLVVGIFLVSR